MRRALAFATFAIAALVWLMVAASTAGAHALLRDSDPKDQALLDTPPTEVVIDFTEPPDLGLSKITVVTADGRAVETGSMEKAPGKGNRVRVALPEIEDGVYTVTWRVLSRVDGHVTGGAFSFGVGVESTALPTGRPRGPTVAEVPRPSVTSVVGRWGLYWGLAMLLGGAVAWLFVFRGPVPRGGALAVIAWSLAAAGLVGMFLAERSSVGVSVGALLSSDRGKLLIARGVALGIAGLGVVFLLVRRSRPAAVALAVTTGAAMAIHAYAGHAGAAESWRWLKVGTQWVHIVAVAIWVGGLVWLLLGTWGRESEERAQAVGRFSFLAGFALAGVASTGAVRAIQEVGWSPGRLFDTGFGLTVVAKSALFGGLVLIGAYNRFRVVPALAAGAKRLGTLRRTVGGEITLATGVFGVTGIMAGLAPPTQYAAVAAPPAPDQVVVVGSDFAQTVRVRLTATPGTPGPNTFDVRIQDFDTSEAVTARSVRLRFRLPERSDIGESELELSRAAEGRWEGQGTNLSVGGTWRVGVLIQQAADSKEIALEVKTRTPVQEVQVIEGGPGQPDLYTISLPGERSVQAYVDPGTGGDNEVHFTFFDPAGEELAVTEATMNATPAGGDGQELEARRLGPGHFVAGVELEPGSWRFAVEAAAEDGATFTAQFDQEIAE
jgi:copper transport protein